MRQCRVCGVDLTSHNSNLKSQENSIYICEECRKRRDFVYHYTHKNIIIQRNKDYRKLFPLKNKQYYHNNRDEIREKALFKKTIKSMCICLNCGELDFRCLQEHHPYKKELSETTFCYCANCHAKLHWNMGKRKL